MIKNQYIEFIMNKTNTVSSQNLLLITLVYCPKCIIKYYLYELLNSYKIVFYTLILKSKLLT